MTSRSTEISVHNFNHVHGDKSSKRISMTMSSSRELPMPNVTRLSSLDQAHATLLLCWTKLSRFTQEQIPNGDFCWSPTSTTQERYDFQEWLELWEAAFSSYLSSAIASMANEDVMQSRILKCNHLACTVLASSSTPFTFDTFEAEFRAIIELAGAVLRSRHVSDSPQNIRPIKQAIPVDSGLDVQEPLRVVMSHCSQESLRIRANELLAIFYQ